MIDISLVLSVFCLILAIAAVILECLNYVRVERMNQVAIAAHRQASDSKYVARAKFHQEQVLGMLLSSILESIYTSNDPNVIQWKLYHLRELDQWLKNHDTRDTATLRDRLAAIAVAPTHVERVEFAKLIKEKMSSYYSMDPEMTKAWTDLLYDLINAAVDTDQEMEEAEEHFQELLRLMKKAKINGAVLELKSEPEFPWDSPKAAFDALIAEKESELEHDQRFDQEVEEIIQDVKEEEPVEDPEPEATEEEEQPLVDEPDPVPVDSPAIVIHEERAPKRKVEFMVW